MAKNMFSMILAMTTANRQAKVSVMSDTAAVHSTLVHFLISFQSEPYDYGTVPYQLIKYCKNMILGQEGRIHLLEI